MSFKIRLIPLHTQKDVRRSPYDPTCTKLYNTQEVQSCRDLGFHRLITSEHSTHTPRCSPLTSRFFVSEFWVCFQVLDLFPSFRFVSEFWVCFRVSEFHRLITSENSTHTTMLDAHPKIFCFWVFRDHFSGDQFYGDHFSRIPLNFVWIR